MIRKKSDNKSNESSRGIPFQAGQIFMCSVIVALVIAFPLFTVWKKDYITEASIKQKSLADSVAVLSAKVAELRIAAASLASNERIELLAGEWLNLRYPELDRIVIVKENKGLAKAVTAGFFANWKFMADLRRQLEAERG